ncbi:MAG: small ribosomal subunit Rsm22 family protein [Pseudomonadota bacterium]
MDAGRLKILKEIRSHFLKDAPSTTKDYWESTEALEAYDAVFARRIQWKWQSVLRELADLKIDLPLGRVLDYGSGTGVASESLGQLFQREYLLFDRSQRAMAFAQKKLQNLGFKCTKVNSIENLAYDTFIASHIFSELEDAEVLKVTKAAERSQFLILVDAGTPAVSKKLINLRDELLEKSWFVVAPCTHLNPCPIGKSTSDWCHFFAKPPSSIFTDSTWGKLARELNIDLRSLPLSYLIMSKTPVKLDGADRLIGRLKRNGQETQFHSCGAKGFCLNKMKIPKKKIKEIEKDSFCSFPLLSESEAES